MTALIQNFSVPAGNDVQIALSVAPDTDLDTLEGSIILWRVYAQQFGIPNFGASETLPPPPPSPSPSLAPLIEKSTDDGTIVVLPSPPMSCQILIASADTREMLRNYYFETSMMDISGNTSTLNCGIMTVTATENPS